MRGAGQTANSRPISAAVTGAKSRAECFPQRFIGPGRVYTERAPHTELPSGAQFMTEMVSSHPALTLMLTVVLALFGGIATAAGIVAYLDRGN